MFSETIENPELRPKDLSSRKILDKCTQCGKVAKVKSRTEIKNTIVTALECGHYIFEQVAAVSNYESIVFDAKPGCNHVWGEGKQRTTCLECGARRLYQFQIEGARAIERANGRFALFDDQGLGKTIQYLAYMKFHPEAFPYLWVTRSGIKFQHAREIVRLLGKEHFPQVLMKGTDTLIPGMKGYLCSYDLFRRFENLDMFAEAGVQSIILDECQAISNSESARTQALRKVFRNIPKIAPLSGTPWKNRGSELYVVLNALDPKLFWSKKDFQDRWLRTYWDKNKEKEGGIRDPEKFRSAIAHIAIRRERVEVMPELPLINRTRLISEVDKAARTLYKEEEDKLIATYNAAALEGTEDSFQTHQKLMSSLIQMRQIVGIAKVNTTCEFAQEFLEDTDRKLVIFVHHIEVGKLIYKRMQDWCAENNYSQPLQLNAQMDSEHRFAVQNEFNGPYKRLLIASTLASGEGLNLQTCSDCIMHERQWNPANEEQAEGRFIRIGQLATSVNATYVHGYDTVDEILDGIVEPKRREFHHSMNKGEMPVWNEQSLVSQLAAAIAAKRK